MALQRKPRKPLPLVGQVAGILSNRFDSPASPQAPSVPPPPRLNWKDLITSDPGYNQSLADILAASTGDRAQTDAALRAALVRFGGAGALGGIAGRLGSIGQGWENLVDQNVLGGAAAADQAGTSLVSQLEKAHRDRLLAEEDIRAAKGMVSSGQSGYEMGRARQDDVIARDQAVNELLSFLREGIGGFARNEGERQRQRSEAAAAAAARVNDLGLEPAPYPAVTGNQPVVLPPAALPPPPRPPVSVRPYRRPIQGWDI